MESHEERADELEQEADRLEDQGERVEQDIDEARSDVESTDVSDQKPEEAPEEQVPDDD